jgi:hypothetical protein
MRVICAWCNLVIREDDGSGLPDSHGLCPKCRDIYYPKGGKRTKQINVSTLRCFRLEDEKDIV